MTLKQELLELANRTQRLWTRYKIPPEIDTQLREAWDRLKTAADKLQPATGPSQK